MDDLTVAFGLMLLMEGVLYALFPDQMRRMMALVLSTPSQNIRMTGIIVASIGFVIIWFVRNY